MSPRRNSGGDVNFGVRQICLASKDILACGSSYLNKGQFKGSECLGSQWAVLHFGISRVQKKDH